MTVARYSGHSRARCTVGPAPASKTISRDCCRMVLFVENCVTSRNVRVISLSTVLRPKTSMVRRSVSGSDPERTIAVKSSLTPAETPSVILRGIGMRFVNSSESENCDEKGIVQFCKDNVSRLILVGHLAHARNGDYLSAFGFRGR